MEFPPRIFWTNSRYYEKVPHSHSEIRFGNCTVTMQARARDPPCTTATDGESLKEECVVVKVDSRREKKFKDDDDVYGT